MTDSAQPKPNRENDYNDKIFYYKKNDFMYWYMVKRSPEKIKILINKWNKDLIDYMELYSSKLYFDEQDSYFKDHLDTIDYNFLKNDFIKEMKQYLKNTIEHNLLADQLHTLKKTWEYHQGVWTCIEKFKLYETILTNDFVMILTKNEEQINQILHHKKIVKKFDQEIANFLKSRPDSYQILINYIQQDWKQIYLPRSLTLAEKENIIINYLQGDEVNWNYLRIFSNNKKVSLSDEAKLLLKEKEERFYKETFEWDNKNHTISRFGSRMEIWIDKDQVEPIIVQDKKGSVWYSCIYPGKYLDKVIKQNSLSQISELLQLLNGQGIINTINFPSQTKGFVDVIVTENQWPTSYKPNTIFWIKERVLLHTVDMFYKYWVKFEDIIDDHIQKILLKHQWLETLQFSCDLKDKSYKERLKSLFPEIDLLFKQYNLYARKWFIDHKLLNISTKPVSFAEVRSSLPNKYFYSSGQETNQLLYAFFSDQSRLFYTKKYKNTYTNLYDLIASGNATIDIFEEYQRNWGIDMLINTWQLSNDNWKLRFWDEYEAYVLKLLYEHDVISYYAHYKDLQDIIIAMGKKGLITPDSSLLTRWEVDYFNYYLNDKSFTDWRRIRNRYVHWSTETDENKIYTDYIITIVLSIMLLSKIEREQNKKRQFWI